MGTAVRADATAVSDAKTEIVFRRLHDAISRGLL
jgi:hypothetical protein